MEKSFADYIRDDYTDEKERKKRDSAIKERKQLIERISIAIKHSVKSAADDGIHSIAGYFRDYEAWDERHIYIGGDGKKDAENIHRNYLLPLECNISTLSNEIETMIKELGFTNFCVELEKKPKYKAQKTIFGNIKSKKVSGEFSGYMIRLQINW